MAVLTSCVICVIHKLNSITEFDDYLGGEGLEFQNDQPIYIQIADFIKEQIASGQILPGAKLPSVREYSVFFEVSALTIQRTMEYLVREQLVVSKKGVGNFVREDCAENLQNVLAETQTRIFVKKMRNCGLSDGEIRILIDQILEEEA